MYDYLLDATDQDTVQPSAAVAADGDRSRLDVYMTGYRKQRQRAYDRAAHLVRNPNHGEPRPPSAGGTTT